MTPAPALAVGACLFALGLATVCVHRNAVRILMGIELMLVAGTINFVTFGRLQGDATSAAIAAISIIAAAAAEAAVALALVFAVFCHAKTPDAEALDLLRR